MHASPGNYGLSSPRGYDHSGVSELTIRLGRFTNADEVSAWVSINFEDSVLAGGYDQFEVLLRQHGIYWVIVAVDTGPASGRADCRVVRGDHDIVVCASSGGRGGCYEGGFSSPLPLTDADNEPANASAAELATQFLQRFEFTNDLRTDDCQGSDAAILHVRDENGDGRDDLLVQLMGQRIQLMQQPNGTFSPNAP